MYPRNTFSYEALCAIQSFGYALFTTINGTLHYIYSFNGKKEISKVSNETNFESVLSGLTEVSIKFIRSRSDMDKINKEIQADFNYATEQYQKQQQSYQLQFQQSQIHQAFYNLKQSQQQMSQEECQYVYQQLQNRQQVIQKEQQQLQQTPAQYQMPPSQPICIMDLPILLENEQFFPYSNTKYLNIDGVKTYCKNLFTPTQYLNQLYENNQNVTCPPYIQNYISYLASNKKEYFNLIMCYLYFIMLPLYIHRQDLATCQLALVIVGGNKSGKEILFNNIIKPILGEKYCLDVDDNLLSKKDYKKEFDNKIFYNFSNLTSKSLANKEKKKLIENILSNKSIMINDNAINTYDKFKIVMLESEYLPYNLPENYYVLKAPNDIENSSYDSLKNISLLENKIEEELPDFMNYIVNYYIKETMDFPQNEIKLISNVTDEKIVQIFSNYLLENHIPTALKENIKLQEEKIKKMEHLYNKFHKVSRPNIHELFKAKFPEHAKTINANFLYKELEKCNPQVLKLTDGYQGDKCFEILKYL